MAVNGQIDGPLGMDEVNGQSESEVHIALMVAIQYTKWYLADTSIQNDLKCLIECFYF